MKNSLAVFLSVVMAIGCLFGSFQMVSEAAGPYYRIPAYSDFRPNKAANDIESIVNGKSIIKVDATDNKVVIDGEAVANIHKEAVEEIEGYITRLNNNGLYLTRDIVNTVTVQINGFDFSEFAEILINGENINKIKDVNVLKIVLKNKNEYIALDNENIKYISENLYGFRIQIKKQSETYSLRFLEGDDSIISKFDADIMLALPAKHRNQTMYLFADNTQENWGGQYNASTNAIEVMTKYTGDYNVATPNIIINDIEGLTDYEKQAIEFMVVRGYFGLNNKKFHPESPLTRYDFAESLVRMFFALDNEAVCTFPDVDRAHYRYVAASQKDNIVKGFDDGRFKGWKNVTVEQVIALTARTINQKNGYVYPENTDKYMNFENDNIIGEWAEKEIALAIREGIYSYDMNLNFSDDVSRKDAAVMLYRLFMIMNNTPEPEEIIEYDVDATAMHKNFFSMKNTIIIGVIMLLINISAFVSANIYIKKKTGK